MLRYNKKNECCFADCGVFTEGMWTPDEAGDKFLVEGKDRREETKSSLLLIGKTRRGDGRRFLTSTGAQARPFLKKKTAFLRQQDNPRLSVILFTVEKWASLDTVTT